MLCQKEIRWFDVFKCELYKIFRNKSMILSLLSISLLPILVFVNLAFKYTEYIESGATAMNPTGALLYVYRVFLPFCVSVMTVQYYLIDYRANSGKLFSIIAYSWKRTIVVRYLVLLSLVITSILLSYLVFKGGVLLFTYTHPLYGLSEYSMPLSLLYVYVKIIAVSCFMAIIGYGLGNISNNYLVPMLFAMVLILIETPINKFVPYYGMGGYIYEISVNPKVGIDFKYAILMAITPFIVFVVNILKLYIFPDKSKLIYTN